MRPPSPLAKGGQHRWENGPERQQENLFCPVPFQRFTVIPGGRAALCCFTWLPTAIGTYENNNVKNVFNSDIAKDIRASILDGSFRFCDLNKCGSYQAGTLLRQKDVTNPTHRRIIDEGLLQVDEGPEKVCLNYDNSCNLSCPSCRTHKILVTEGKSLNRLARIQTNLLADVLPVAKKRRIRFVITGSGDPFASRLLRKFLFSLDGTEYPFLEIQFTTNGVLFTESCWERMKKIHGNIKEIHVSFDASTPETYNVLRRGGDWNQLQANMRFLSEMREKGMFQNLQIHCVVQRQNYRELHKLVRIAKEFRFVDCVRFQKIFQWRHITDQKFKKEAVWHKNHPEYEQFLDILGGPCFAHPIVDLVNLTPLRQRALQRLTNGGGSVT